MKSGRIVLLSCFVVGAVLLVAFKNPASTLTQFLPHPRAPGRGAAQGADSLTRHAIAGSGRAQRAAAARDSISGQQVTCTDFRSNLPLTLSAQHLAADGTIDAAWTPDGRLCLGSADGVSAKMVSDGSGGAFVVWVDERSGDGDLYAQRFTSNGAIASGWPNDGVALCTAPGSQYQVVLTGDGQGGVLAAWQDFRAGGLGDIYVQRLSSQGQPLWGKDGAPVCTHPAEQGSPAILSDGTGGALVVWHDRRSGEPRLYRLHVTASGTADPADSSNGTPLLATTGAELNPRALGTASGGGFVVWEDQRSGPASLYALGFGQGGVVATGWPSGGQAVTSSAAADQHEAALVSDGSGGVIVAWSVSSADGGDISAQRLSSAGERLWNADGVLVCAAAHEQSGPVLASDGSDGAIVCWEDRRRGWHSDLYAQRVGSGGTVQWASDGVPVCICASNEHDPAISSDGSGGAVITWTDERARNQGQLFALRPIYGGAAPQLEKVEANPTRVEITWKTSPHDAMTYTVQRQLTAPDWVAIGTVHADGDAKLRWTDEHLSPGTHLEYRLVGETPAAEVILGQLGVDLPLPKPLAVRFARWDRSRRAVQVAYTLADGERARLEVFDVAGRRVADQDLGAPGPGDYETHVGESPPLYSGVYFLRLSQGRAVRTAKAVVLR